MGIVAGRTGQFPVRERELPRFHGRDNINGMMVRSLVIRVAFDTELCNGISQ